MEQCLHQWFVRDGALRSSCDFHERLFSSDTAVYEVIRLIDGKPLFLKEHLFRLDQSMLLTFKAGYDLKAAIVDTLWSLIEANNISTGNIKLYVCKTATHPSPSVSAWFIPHFYPTAEMYRTGVKVALFAHERKQPNAKINNASYKATAEAAMQKAEAFELLLHKNGMITEGSRSSVFFIHEGELKTAPDPFVLQGITRHKVLQIISSRAYPLHFECLPIDRLGQIEAAFLCGTSPKVLAISNVEDRIQLSPHHPLIQSISEDYDRMIQENINNFSWSDITTN